MKKIFYILASCLMLSACSFNQAKNIKNCTFAFESISDLMVNDISFDGKRSLRDFSSQEVALISQGLMNDMPISFVSNIQINNPNKQKAELNTLEWTLLIQNVEIANGVLDEKIEIEANQSVSVPIEVETNTNILKQFSLTEIKNIIFEISRTNRLPKNSTLTVKPAIKIGKKMITVPYAFNIDFSKK